MVATILAVSLFMPLASAHGANDFSIIMRSSSLQPSEAEVLQNDSVTFYNVADVNRTIRVDLDGDGVYDQRCETEPYNSSSVKDECSFMIYAESWGAGNYLLDVFTNDTLWATLNLTVIHDYHEELGPPSGYVFNNGTSGSEEDGGGLEDSLRDLSIFLLICSALVWVARRNGDE
ncbi:MAG: hypothetical protein QGF32_06375 [Candidatus Thalassarchaeaceae archaeon]|nr:hypothetical protein [Candidatus Thalassarchaeaceae archaeon]